MPDDRPNILILMTDHQRYDTVLPEHPCRTPNVQRLIDAGVTFTQTHCTAPHCCPARASFWSGQYPSQHGVWNNICNGNRLSDGIHPHTRLWSSDLHDAGYAMHFSGKWHVDTKTGPEDHGFADRGATAKGDAVMGQTWDMLQQTADQPDPKPADRQWGQLLRPGYGPPVFSGFGALPHRENHPDLRCTQRALASLDELTAGDHPWCLFAGFIGPHDPFYAPQEFIDLYPLEDVPLPESYDDEMRDKPGLYRRMREQVFGQWSREEARDAIRHFWAYCSWLDHLFGKLLDKLEDTGQADNTIVLYCSDHGDYCGEHRLFAKGIPAFDGAYHVPGVVRWPEGIKNPGRRCDELVSLCDFGPTFLDAAGVRVDRGFAGRSLMPLLRGEKPGDWRDALLMQCNGVENYVTQRTIRTADWRYTYNAFDFDELYDLRNDPHEMTNLAHDPQHDATKRELCARMWALCEEVDDVPGNSYFTTALAPTGPAAGLRYAKGMPIDGPADDPAPAPADPSAKGAKK
ncbi:MAG: sulfatase-like hydrolase/transferase [Phycisphaeraceae bacterium]